VSGPRLRRILLGAAALAMIAVPLSATSASAASGDVTIKFTKSALTVEYGQYWSAQMNVAKAYPCQYKSCAHVISIFNAGDSTPLTTEPIGVWSETTSAVSAFDLSRPLPVGKYSLTAAFKRYALTGGSAVPLAVTVTPTSLSTAVRVTNDRNHPTNAVISATLSGKYLEAISGEIGGAVFPAGSWHVTVKNSAGDEIFTKTSDQKAGGDPFTSVYWPGVPPGGDFTASASFTPSAASAANFTIVAAKDATYTGPAAPNTGPTPTSTPTPIPNQAATQAGSTVPVWSLGVAGIIAIVLVIALMLLSAALRRSVSAAAAASPAAVAPTAEKQL
jgi:hypothetical protein